MAELSDGCLGHCLIRKSVFAELIFALLWRIAELKYFISRVALTLQ